MADFVPALRRLLALVAKATRLRGFLDLNQNPQIPYPTIIR